jgi:ketosteroid isomerase-like protein
MSLRGVKGLVLGLALLLLNAPVPSSGGEAARHPDRAELQRQVQATEVAFAKTMADRNHEAFSSFLSEEAVFLSGSEVLRGKAQVAQGWKSLFESPEAPFSWEPEKIEVLDSGKLALSTGPVHQGGKLVGTFTSIWRLEAPGRWRIVFDTGCQVCQACAR